MYLSCSRALRAIYSQFDSGVSRLACDRSIFESTTPTAAAFGPKACTSFSFSNLRVLAPMCAGLQLQQSEQSLATPHDRGRKAHSPLYGTACFRCQVKAHTCVVQCVAQSLQLLLYVYSSCHDVLTCATRAGLVARGQIPGLKNQNRTPVRAPLLGLCALQLAQRQRPAPLVLRLE